MCVGAISTLVDVWEVEGTRLGRLADGAVVSLAMVPEARADDHLLVHLGVPVEVLAPDTAAQALALREERR